MKKHWWFLSVLIFAACFLQSIPQGFFTTDEIIENTQKALNNERSSYIADMFAGDVHFNVFAEHMINQVKQTEQYQAAPEEQQELFLEQLLGNFEKDRKEHSDNIIDAVIQLGTRFTKLLFDHPDIYYMGLNYHSIEYSTTQDMYGVTIHENTILYFNDEENMIECNYPEILEIDGGLIIEKAPEFTVYRYAFPVEEIASEIARSFGYGRFNIIDSLYVNEAQMQKKLDIVLKSFQQGEQYKAMTENQQQEFEAVIEEGRKQIGTEMYEKRKKTEEAWETIEFGHDCFDYQDFSVDSCEPGNITTDQGVQSMNGTKMTFSNKDYIVKVNISEMISFGDLWKIVGSIDFTVEEK